MLTCRYFVTPSKDLHVHDDPGYMVDAIRCQANGWTVWVDGKCHVEGPYTKGDSKPSFIIIDYASLHIENHKERGERVCTQLTPRSNHSQ